MTSVESVTPTQSCCAVRWIPACIPTCFGISVVSSGKAFADFQTLSLRLLRSHFLLDVSTKADSLVLGLVDLDFILQDFIE